MNQLVLSKAKTSYDIRRAHDSKGKIDEEKIVNIQKLKIDEMGCIGV
jgi:hypothetical protein